MKYFDDLSTITSDCVDYKHNATPERFQQYQDIIEGLSEVIKNLDCKVTYSFHAVESYEVYQLGSHIITYYALNELIAFLHGMTTMKKRKENEEADDRYFTAGDLEPYG